MYKRLQTILHLLDAHQYSEALEEVDSLLFFQDNTEIQKLYEFIKKANYSEAKMYCQTLINKQEKPDHTDNFDLVGLQTTYQMLKTQFLVLTTQKTEADKILTQFRIRYYQELGFLISEILQKRIKIFESIRDSNPDAQYEHEKTKQQYAQFSKNWEQVPHEHIGNISEEIKQRLQFAFRKASKLCHPDAVSEENKSQAAEIFVQLNKAYFENDVDTVENILQQLENGILEATTSHIDTKKSLKAKISKLKHDIGLLTNEYQSLTQSPTYQFIIKLEDWDRYFNETKQKLEKELEELKEYGQKSGNTTNAN